MTPPAFWANPPNRPGVLAHLLSPLSTLYAKATARRLQNGPRHRVDIPVICVGNINAGGTGKTPTVIALCELAHSMGKAPHIVSRGYGGTLEGPVRIDPTTHNADEAGDEPLLLAAFAPTWVAKDRTKGAAAAKAAGADLIILDDGFQNPSLHHDLSIIVIDAAAGFGNGRVIPAGPLREPVTTGLKRADFTLQIGADHDIKTLTHDWPQLQSLPSLTATLTPLETGMHWPGTKVIAFAGIGRPQKFFDTLQSLGANIVATHALADHATLPTALLQRLLREARAQNAQLVTTEKDATRLPHTFRLDILTLPVRLKLTDASPLKNHLQTSIFPKYLKS